MLPRVPNFLMTYDELVNAISTIQPETVMLFHDNLAGYTDFYETCGDLFEAEFLLLDHYESTRL